MHTEPFGSVWKNLEKIAKFYSMLSETKYTIIRHSIIYGPHDKYDLDRSHVFGATITKVLTAKKKIEVWGTGNEIRDFLYADDLVNFIKIAINKLTITTTEAGGSGGSNFLNSYLWLLAQGQEKRRPINKV